MKKRFLTLIVTFILAAVTAATAGAVDVNDPAVFLKEQSSGTCTLTSAAMMLRRKAVLDADANWQATTVASVRRVSWSGGLAWNFTYNGLHVTTARKNSWAADSSVESKKQALISMLEAHPEGFVAYSPSTPHAVLLTDYDYNTGVFYCAEPATTYPTGKIPLTSSVIKGASQDDIIQKITQLWYISSGVSNGAGTASWAVVEEEEPETPLARNTVQEVEVNGETVRLQLYALLDEQGNDVNYVKLRELAQTLNGTTAQFDVGYDGTITLTTSTPYLPVEESGEAAFLGDQPYTLPTADTTVDGEAVELDAIQLTDEQGGGHTYYNLRDLGKILGYQVEWDPQTGIRIRVDEDVDLEDIPSDHQLELELNV